MEYKIIQKIWKSTNNKQNTDNIENEWQMDTFYFIFYLFLFLDEALSTITTIIIIIIDFD